MKRQMHGFSLLELMIAVAIVAIIASVAYPSYTGYVINSKRADGRVALVAFANAMDRWLTQNGSYLGAAEGGDTGAPRAAIYASQTPKVNPNYMLTINAATASTYQLKATPTPALGDTTCMYLDQTGTESSGAC